MFYIKYKNHGIKKDKKYRTIRQYETLKEAENSLSNDEQFAYLSLLGVMNNDELTEVSIFENDKWINPH